jgi:hypothetical protein
VVLGIRINVETEGAEGRNEHEQSTWYDVTRLPPLDSEPYLAMSGQLHPEARALAIRVRFVYVNVTSVRFS